MAGQERGGEEEHLALNPDMAKESGDGSGIGGNTKDDSLFVSQGDPTPVSCPEVNIMKRMAEDLAGRGTVPEQLDRSADNNKNNDNDNEDDNGDSHRDKRRRDSNFRNPDTRVHLDLMTERTGRRSGVNFSLHDPELYEQFRRAEAAGIYLGPGANVVVKRNSPAMGEQAGEEEPRLDARDNIQGPASRGEATERDADERNESRERGLQSQIQQNAVEQERPPPQGMTQGKH